MACKGENDVGELEVGLGERLGRRVGEGRRLVVGRLETVGVGGLHAGDNRGGARIHDALVEPDRREIAALIEGHHRFPLFLDGEELVGLRGEKVADLLGGRAVGRVERGERIRRGRGLGRGCRSLGGCVSRGALRGRRGRCGSGLRRGGADFQILCQARQRRDEDQRERGAGEDVVIT